MSDRHFEELRLAVQAKFKTLMQLSEDKQGVLLRADFDGLWDFYLESIPSEHNPIFRERRVYDANYDKNFIERVGNVVYVSNDCRTVESIWDVKLSKSNYFIPVVEHLANIKHSLIGNVFLITEPTAGHKPNIDKYDTDILWRHFYAEISNEFVKRKDDIGDSYHKFKTNYDGLWSSMTALSLDAGLIVEELIKDNVLYRGIEFISIVQQFIKLKNEYDALDSEISKDRWTWVKSIELGGLSGIKNTVIGTLLEDLSYQMGVEDAVKRFEAKVAPTNYKRSSLPITAKMVENAQAKIAELGLSESIYRTFATEQDVPVVERLFSATSNTALDVFDELAQDSDRKVKEVKDVQDISWDDFVAKVLPTVKGVEVLQTQAIKANEFVLTTNKGDSKPMFKWDNQVAWTYLSDTTDAIKTRVKEAGGDIAGDLRVSLSWHSGCDLDLHCGTPYGHILYSDRNYDGGFLDIDMNGMDKHDAEHPVENIIFKTKDNMPVGHYKFMVNNYNMRSPRHTHFDIQVEMNDTIQTYRYDETVPNRHTVECFTVVKGADGRLTLEGVLDKLKLVDTTSTGNTLIPVKFITKSPNYWGNNAVGNEHILFVTDGFKTDSLVRPFFNEYLQNDLLEHRKVFEVLGSKLKLNPVNEVSLVGGYGFSVTAKGSVVVRTTGQQRKFYNIKF